MKTIVFYKRRNIRFIKYDWFLVDPMFFYKIVLRKK